MGVNFLGLDIPTSAGEAGANLHNNFRPAVAQANAAIMNTPPVAAGGLALSGLQDFFHGLTTGHALGQAAAAQTGPQTTTKAQAKPQAIGGKFVELPGVGRVQMPSDAFLHAHPADASIDTSSPAPKEGAAKGSAKASNPFDELVARYAQANGGTLSLGEMSSLADIATKTSVLRTQPKDPTAKDAVAGKLNAVADQIYTMKLAQAQALKAKDPAGAAKLQDDAVSGYQDALQKILGSNPVDLQTAAAMGTSG